MAGRLRPVCREMELDMSEQAETREALVDVGLALIADQGWHRTTVPQMAMQLGTPVLGALRMLPGKVALLHAVLDRLDADVAANAGNWTAAEPVNDRLFDAIMARFEYMQQNRSAFVAVLKGLALDPVAVAAVARRYDTSLDRTLEAAGLGAGLVAGVGRRAALAALMLDLMRVWVADESPDMAATMGALGKRLEQFEDVSSRLDDAGETVQATVQEGLARVMGGRS